MSHDSTAADTRLDFFRILYDLIISQLEYDGYSRTSRCLSDELLENKRIPGEKSDGLGAKKSINRIDVPMTTKDDTNIGADHLKQILVWCFGINRKIASLSAENHGVFGKSGHAVDQTDGETPATRDSEEKSVTTCIKPEMRDPSPAQCSTPSDVTAGDMAGSVPGDTIPLFTPHPMIVDQMTVSTHVSTPPASSPASLPPPAGVLQSVKAGVTSSCLVSPASLSPPLDVSSPNITSAGGSGVITPKALCNPKSPSAMLSDQQQFTNNNSNNICSMLVSAERFLDMSGPKKTRLFCRFCGKFFAQQSALLVHERIHTGEKPFRCRYCGRAFSQVSNMKSHERLHTGEKPYQCGECGKRFTQSASLRCHVRSHTGERPYSCTFCGKSFTQPASLQHHIRTHTGEKPYKCDHCDKKFTQPSSLVAHRRSHFQPSMPVVCPVCFHGFHRTADLKTHMLIHQTAAVSADKLFPSLSENAGLMSGDHQTTPAIASVPSTTGLSFNIGEPFSLQGLPIGT